MPSCALHSRHAILQLSKKEITDLHVHFSYILSFCLKLKLPQLLPLNSGFTLREAFLDHPLEPGTTQSHLLGSWVMIQSTLSDA